MSVMAVTVSEPADPADPAAQAAEAVRLVQVRPREAQELASAALARSRRVRDRAAASTAERALGLVAKERNDFRAACEHLRAAVRLGERSTDPRRAAEARMSLSLVLVHCGRTAEAVRQADLAVAAFRGADAGPAHMQRALVLQQLGRFDEALEGYRRALAGVRRSGDRQWEARVLGNRGVLHTYRRDFHAAEADLVRADELFSQLGLALGAGMVRHNLGYLFACKGDVPAALEQYDRAAESYREADVDHPVLLFDRGELLLGVRLVAEARQAAEQAVAELAGKRMSLRLAEARLMLSQAALLDGDVATARTAAEQAARAFTRQGRTAWAALARYATVRAAWAAGDRSPRSLGLACRTADALAHAGWPVVAMDARVLACRIALELRKVDVADRELRLASRGRHRGPVELRARAWHANALLALARGNRRAAVDALRSGMAVLDDHRAALGAPELRAHVSGHGSELALAGLRLAVEDGDVAAVFEWAERWRAGALRARAVRPPRDPALARDLAELRRTVQERDAAALAGRETAALNRRQAELEQAIRHRSLRIAGSGVVDAAGPAGLDALCERLGERALVEVVDLEGDLHAVVVTPERVALRHLGPSRTVADELRALTFGLRRLARRSAPASVAAAVAAATHAAGRIDDLLFGPVRADLHDLPLVLVPTGTLHGTPWSLLPTCRGRPVTVSPSAELWRGDGPVVGDGRRPVVLVAGPDLRCAADELDALTHRYPGAVTLTAAQATTAGVLAALDGAGLAHVAAHGSFRVDNPLFSCLRLADGPLTVYDLESLSEAPGALVLSACESGLSSVQPGDELMGLSAALFELGTRTLVASVLAVPDDHTARFMVAFHDLLTGGLAPAEALSRAQVETPGDDPQALAASAAFVCFGSG
jgi:tetratricopeptide (TPR) repeat protein